MAYQPLSVISEELQGKLRGILDSAIVDLEALPNLHPDNFRLWAAYIQVREVRFLLGLEPMPEPFRKEDWFLGRRVIMPMGEEAVIVMVNWQLEPPIIIKTPGGTHEAFDPDELGLL